MQVRKIGNTATSPILQGFRCPFPLATQRQRLATNQGFLDSFTASIQNFQRPVEAQICCEFVSKTRLALG
jgi:hypothetical protein